MFNQCSLEETLEGPLSLRQAEGKQLVLKKYNNCNTESPCSQHNKTAKTQNKMKKTTSADSL